MDAGQHANGPALALAELIGELSVKSGDFRAMWAIHNVKRKTHDSMQLTHPLVGEVDLHYETFALPSDQEQFLSTCHAEPGSTSAEALRLLTSWDTDTAQDRSAALRD